MLVHPKLPLLHLRKVTVTLDPKSPRNPELGQDVIPVAEERLVPHLGLCDLELTRIEAMR